MTTNSSDYCTHEHFSRKNILYTRAALNEYIITTMQKETC